MKIDSIITEKKSRKKSKQVKASEKTPKLIKPNTGHESPHPMQGRMVGEGNEEQFGGRFIAQDFNDILRDPILKLPKNTNYNNFLKFMDFAMTDSRYKGLTLEQFSDKLKMIFSQWKANSVHGVDEPNNKGSIPEPIKQTIYKKSQAEPNRNESKINEAPYSANKSALLKAVMAELEKNAQDEEGIKLLRRLASIINKRIIKRENGKLALESKIPFTECPKCGGSIVHESQLNEKQDACYHKVKSRYKVWPSAYASGALVKCRKVGAKNWGNSSKKK